MIRVKLTTNFPEWPLIRQTPGRRAIWGECRFFINEAVEECDFWAVFDDVVQPETTRCPPENILLITGEPPSVKTYSPRFTAQFAQVLTCQREIKHAGAVYRQQALAWMAGCRYCQEKGQWETVCTKDYDELSARPIIPKTKRLSVISSDKAWTPGHRQRLEFVQHLKQHFGEEIDVYGRGLQDFADKWDVIAPYQYHIVLENGQFRDYWTEKLSDALLAGAYPLYSGCPNIGDYFADEILTRLDTADPKNAIRAIETAMQEDRFTATITARSEAARQVLDEYSLFPTLETFARQADLSLPAQTVTLQPQSSFPATLAERIQRRARRMIAQATHRTAMLKGT